MSGGNNMAHPVSQDRAAHEPSQSSLSRPSGEHPLRGRFGILLDSGAVFTVKARTKADAVAALRRWKQARKDALQRGDIVQPRQALGLVTVGASRRKAKAA